MHYRFLLFILIIIIIITLLVLKTCTHKNSSNKVKQQARGKIAYSLPRNEFVKSINKSLDLKEEIKSELNQSLCKSSEHN